MTIVLADIGGTHARFACYDEQDAVKNAETLAAASHASLADALKFYSKQHGLSGAVHLYIATAAQPDSDGQWRFLNQNSWRIDINNLADRGIQVKRVMNDFAASARGILSMPEGGITTLKDGAPSQVRPRVVIGPGTGLGLSWMAPFGTRENRQRWHIQETYGGHMLMPSATAEQADIFARIHDMKPDRTVIVPEDIVSGRGLPFLFAAVCQRRGEDVPDRSSLTPELILSGDSEAHRDTHRVFFECLGLFAQMAVTVIHAYGGVYFEGGILKRLYEQDGLDFESFMKFFILDTVPTVRNDLENTPVYLIEEQYSALYGLAEMVGQNI